MFILPAKDLLFVLLACCILAKHGYWSKFTSIPSIAGCVKTLLKQFFNFKPLCFAGTSRASR